MSIDVIEILGRDRDSREDRLNHEKCDENQRGRLAGQGRRGILVVGGIVIERLRWLKVICDLGPIRRLGRIRHLGRNHHLGRTKNGISIERTKIMPQ